MPVLAVRGPSARRRPPRPAALSGRSRPPDLALDPHLRAIDNRGVGRPKVRLGEPATSVRLLAAAEEVFARDGYDGATLEEVARRAGISRPSLLYHFESKQALYAAVVEDVLAELARVIAVGVERRGEFTEQLLSMLDGLLAFVRNRPSAARLLVREVLDGKGPGHALVEQAAVPVLEQAERFIRVRGRGIVRPDLPIRAALMQLISAVFVQSASASMAASLWGPERDAHTRDLVRILFLDAPRPPSPVAEVEPPRSS
jgi:AcrR family transcriptional regulator